MTVMHITRSTSAFQTRLLPSPAQVEKKAPRILRKLSQPSARFWNVWTE